MSNGSSDSTQASLAMLCRCVGSPTGPPLTWCMAVAVCSAAWKRPSTSGSTAPGHTYDRWHSALQLADTRAASGQRGWGGVGGEEPQEV